MHDGMTHPPPAPLPEADYEMIEAAVMETARGRWFLAEYARRNRQADTASVLAAVERLERVVRRDRTLDVQHALRSELVGMNRSLERLHEDLAALATKEGESNRLAGAEEDLEAVVKATERATQDILGAAERVQEVAWVLREQGVDALQCDALDERATEIYLACSFQDLTGQRIARVVTALREIERRLGAALESAGVGDAPPSSTAGPRPTLEAHLLNGPARAGEGMEQTAIDGLLASAEAAPSSEPEGSEPAALADDDLFERPAPPETPALAVVGATALAPSAAEPLRAPAPRLDFDELSFAEKAALFS
jgi:chemotaxis regulatin CheY-phosphate phosphatase CheZ